MKKLSQRRRAQAGLFLVVVLNLGVYIWSIVMQVRFDSNNPGKIDWEDALYARSFLPYFFVQTTGPLSQSYMYWLLSSFATDAQGKPSLIVMFCRPILTHFSKRSQWCCIPLSGGHRPGDLLRHEHADQDKSYHRLLRYLWSHVTCLRSDAGAGQLYSRPHSCRRDCRGDRACGEQDWRCEHRCESLKYGSCGIDHLQAYH
jgi:hypothetical protein